MQCRSGPVSRDTCQKKLAKIGHDACPEDVRCEPSRNLDKAMLRDLLPTMITLSLLSIQGHVAAVPVGSMRFAAGRDGPASLSHLPRGHLCEGLNVAAGSGRERCC